MSWALHPAGKVGLLTVTVTVDEVVALPEESVATAVSECEAFVAVVVFHEYVYGELVIAEPRGVPSSLNCTLATATLSDAVAVMLVVPATVALFAGAVIDTVGTCVSVTTMLVIRGATHRSDAPILPPPVSAVCVRVKSVVPFTLIVVVLPLRETTTAW